MLKKSPCQFSPTTVWLACCPCVCASVLSHLSKAEPQLHRTDNYDCLQELPQNLPPLKKLMAGFPPFLPQYEPGVLEACLKLLQVSPQHQSHVNQDYILRADPVYLCRVICAMVRQK